MNLFGPRKVVDQVARDELARLRDEMQAMQSVLRQFEAEQQSVHTDVRRWMRRAVAAERAVLRNQEPELVVPAAGANGHATPAAPAPPLSRLTLRGARNRIKARQRLEAEAEYLRQVSEGAPATPPAAPVDEPVPPGVEPEGA